MIWPLWQYLYTWVWTAEIMNVFWYLWHCTHPAQLAVAMGNRRQYSLSRSRRKIRSRVYKSPSEQCCTRTCSLLIHQVSPLSGPRNLFHCSTGPHIGPWRHQYNVSTTKHYRKGFTLLRSAGSSNSPAYRLAWLGGHGRARGRAFSSAGRVRIKGEMWEHQLCQFYDSYRAHRWDLSSLARSIFKYRVNRENITTSNLKWKSYRSSRQRPNLKDP